jgi:tRNA dimethylallyltransferase
VGFKELFAYMDGQYDLDTAVELIRRNTRRYAKRQLTWFARDKEMIWRHPEDFGILNSNYNIHIFFVFLQKKS